MKKMYPIELLEEKALETRNNFNEISEIINKLLEAYRNKEFQSLEEYEVEILEKMVIADELTYFFARIRP